MKIKTSNKHSTPVKGDRFRGVIMRTSIKILGFVIVALVASNTSANTTTMTLYGLELGGPRSLQQQLGLGQQSFFLEDANLLSHSQLSSGKTRSEHQIACKQSSFGVNKVLSETYQNLTGQDEYLSSRKESLNRRIKNDLEAAQASLINTVSKKYSQPQCNWAFNSAEYADSETPTLVKKFKAKSGIDKLATVQFSVNHAGQLIALQAGQLVERLDVERVDGILKSISKRYGIDIELLSQQKKSAQKKVLEGKQPVIFTVDDIQCQITIQNTYYRSDAVAAYFGVDQAHGYIEMGCELPSFRAFNDEELHQYVQSRVNDTLVNLLDKHKTQMKADGQKEQNAGFVF